MGSIEPDYSTGLVLFSLLNRTQSGESRAKSGLHSSKLIGVGWHGMAIRGSCVATINTLSGLTFTRSHFHCTAPMINHNCTRAAQVRSRLSVSGNSHQIRSHFFSVYGFTFQPKTGTLSPIIDVHYVLLACPAQRKPLGTCFSQGTSCPTLFVFRMVGGRLADVPNVAELLPAPRTLPLACITIPR